MNENEKKNNRKNENFEEKKKMVWRYGGEGATHKIWPGSMQRFPRNLRTPDDGHMRHDSSSAV